MPLYSTYTREVFHEPRVSGITAVMSFGFLINAAGVQHIAILARQLRYVALTIIEITAMLISTAVGIAMAIAGFGYWSLVGSTLALTTASTIGAWVASGWIPGMPCPRDEQIRSMLRFGGICTLNGMVVYFGYNLEKVLLGRFWGADALGIYGRAYQLINIPTMNLHAAIGGVAFSVLSRLQHEPVRYKDIFSQQLLSDHIHNRPCNHFLRLERWRHCLGRSWTEMDRGDGSVPAAGPNGPGVRSNQSNGLVSYFIRSPSAQLDFGVDHRAARPRSLFHWIAVWPDRRRIRLFDCAFVVAHSASRVVRAWHPNNSARPRDRSRSIFDCGRGGRGSRLGRAWLDNRLRMAGCQAHARELASLSCRTIACCCSFWVKRQCTSIL